MATVGRHRHGSYRIMMPAQGMNGLSGGQVPNVQRPVPRAGHYVSVVRRHCHRSHRNLMAAQRLHGLCGS